MKGSARAGAMRGWGKGMGFACECLLLEIIQMVSL